MRLRLGLRCFALLFLGLVAAAPGTATPWIGIAVEEAPDKRGVLVKRALPDTPAAKAGLQSGDLILRVDGQPFNEPGPFITYVQSRGVGAEVKLELVRATQPVTVTLALEARPDELERLRRLLVGKPAGELGIVHAAGPALGKHAGQVVVLEFMATWCGACRAASPTLDAWQKKYGDRGLVIIAVSAEEAPLLVKHHAALGATYIQAHDPKGALTGRFEVPAYPTFVVIDRAGNVKAVDIGAGRVLDAVEATFVPLLGAKPPAAAPVPAPAPRKRPKK